MIATQPAQVSVGKNIKGNFKRGGVRLYDGYLRSYVRRFRKKRVSEWVAKAFGGVVEDI